MSLRRPVTPTLSPCDETSEYPRIAPPERRELERRMRTRAGRAEDARRARLMLMLAAGRPYSEICPELGCSSVYVARWKERFQKDRLAGLDSRHVGRKALYAALDTLRGD